MKNVVVIILLTGCAFPSLSQSVISFQGVENVQDIKGAEILVNSFDNRYQGVRGTPYLFNDWTPFRIIDNGVEFRLDSKLQANESKLIYQINRSYFQKDLSDIDSIFLVLGTQELQVSYTNKYRTALLVNGVETNYQIDVIKQLRKANYEGAYSQNRPYDEYITEVQLLKCNSNSCSKLKGKELSRLGINKKELKETLNEGDFLAFSEQVKKLYP